MADPSSISCVMALHNGATYVAEAIESLVGQSLRPAEIIVVDDGSSDDGPAIAKAAGKGLVTILHQAQAGLDAARNAGRARAVSRFVHFFDDDDIAPPDALASLAAAHAAHPESDAVFGRRIDFWIDALAHERPPNGDDIRPGMWMTSGLFRRDILDSHPFYESLPGQYNSPRWLVERKDAGARFVHIDALTLRRRIHHKNMSRRKSTADMLALVADLRRRARRD